MVNRVIAAIAGVAGFWFLLLARPRSPGEALVRFAFAAILLIFAWKRYNASPARTARYARREEGVWVRFDVAPVAPPVNWFAATLSVVLGGATVGSGTPYLWAMGLVFAGVAALVLLLDPRGGHAARRGHFRLGPDGIQVGDRLLRRSDIHHLGIRNGFAGNVEIVYDAGRGLSTGTIAGLAHRRKLAEVAYRVQVESGGQAYTLAAGLDEATARGMIGEVGHALGRGNSPAS